VVEDSESNTTFMCAREQEELINRNIFQRMLRDCGMEHSDVWVGKIVLTWSVFIVFVFVRASH